MLDRRHLESAGANYPYTHVQGLYGIPFGMAMALAGLTNLVSRPAADWILGGGLLLCLAALAGVFQYYRRTLGRVVPTSSRQMRYLVATAAGFACFVAADQLGRAVLGRPPRQPICITAAAWALGMLVFYAATASLKAHNIAVWGAVLVAGLLPIWGRGVDRDAIAYLPIGAAAIVSGLLDHRLVVRAFGSFPALTPEERDAGA